MIHWISSFTLQLPPWTRLLSSHTPHSTDRLHKETLGLRERVLMWSTRIRNFTCTPINYSGKQRLSKQLFAGTQPILKPWPSSEVHSLLRAEDATFCSDDKEKTLPPWILTARSLRQVSILSDTLNVFALEHLNRIFSRFKLPNTEQQKLCSHK